MGRRTAVVTGLVAVAVLAGGSAVPASAGRPVRDPQQQTLRDLAQRHHLAVGTAIDVAALDDPAYRQVASTQFSSVTAENVMKWETLEPMRGRTTGDRPTSSWPSPRPTTRRSAATCWCGTTSCRPG